MTRPPGEAPMQSYWLTYLRRFPIDKGKSRLSTRVKLEGVASPVVYRTPLGVTYELHLDDHVMREIYLYGQYERNTLRHLLRLADRQSVFVDVGANVGAYTLPLARRLQPGAVHAFEPNPRTCALLQRNLVLSQLEHVLVNPIGLADAPGSLTLYGDSLTTASGYKHHDSGTSIDVPLTTLEAYCEEHGLEKVDLLKVDIEGGEMRFLDGAEQVIRRSPRMVLVAEIDQNCEHAGHSREELFQRITGLGFDAYMPSAFPFPMRRMRAVPDGYTDNVIFLKGF